MSFILMRERKGGKPPEVKPQSFEVLTERLKPRPSPEYKFHFAG
jgi:hypothetical protein